MHTYRRFIFYFQG